MDRSSRSGRSGSSPPRHPSQSEPLPTYWLWLAIALVAGLYAAHVRYYGFVGDDAFISFRYAKNLADGLGLVWNAGERVEGYTNFLWVLILAGGMRVGVQPEGLSCVLGVLSGGGVLLLLGRFSARRRGWTHPAVWLPLLALVLSRSFSAWSTGGLATQFFALLVVAAQLRFVRENEDASISIYGSSLLFALATLTRPEAGLFTAVAGLAFLVEVRRGRRDLGALVRWTLPWFAIVGSHFLWRYAYYDAWLPNTFYAKVNGIWFEQALRYFWVFQQDYKLLFFAPFAIAAIVRLRGFAHVYLAAGIAAHGAYLFAVGGDRFEFRFLVVILPTLYWLITEGLVWLSAAQHEDASRWTRSRLAAVAFGFVLLATTLHGSFRPEATRMRHGIESIQVTRAYAERRIREGRLLASYVEAGILPRDLPFSAGGVGALPYYAGWPTLDTRGLNDRVIARSEIKTRSVVAHEHHATPEYMRARGVVVFDSMNNLLFHDDPMRYQGRTKERGGEHWKLRAVRLGEHTMVFTTMLPEEEFQQYFEALEILY